MIPENSINIAVHIQLALDEPVCGSFELGLEVLFITVVDVFFVHSSYLKK